MKSLFQIQNVTKKYRDVTALENISFDIQQGEILGYIGPNGAGRTTTIKILVGLIKKYQGTVVYEGHDASTPGISSKFRRELGYLPQEAGFQQWRTVDHALRSFGLLSGIPREEINEAITHSLELVGLLDVQKKKIEHLSGGMKQKLKFAQALIHNPKFLVLDEPMSGLDPSSRYQFKNIIKQLQQWGITIFLSSHILGDIENLATRIAILHQGKIMKTGTPAELSEEFRIGNNIKVVYMNGSTQIQKDDIAGIDSIIQETNLVHLIHSTPEKSTDEVIHSILQYIVEHKLHVRSVQLQEPNLEDVYLHYVGGRQLQ